MHKNKKFDLVYTWVDDTDTKWLNKKNATLENMGFKVDKNATSACRYRNNNELKYSLRSVEKYASWINHIYIITDNQIPMWMNIKNPKINIIDHKDIIPEDALPTYNSNSILHCIVNIPNLSEYFLYCDDDMLFGDYTYPEFFLTKSEKLICRFRKDIKLLKDSLWKQMLLHTIDILKNKNYKFPSNGPHHNIDIYKKSIIIDCQKEFKKEIENTIYNKFRTSTDVERIIYSYYALAKQQGIFKEVYHYDVSKPFIKKFSKRILKGSYNDSKYFSCDHQSIEKYLTKFQPKLFCINDGEEINNNNKRNVIQILEKIFPEKSSFEK